MNYEEYMTFEAKLERDLGEDPDIGTHTYDKPVVIKVFKYGKTLNVHRGSEEDVVNAQVYLTMSKVTLDPVNNLRDRLDGQVVKSVNHYPGEWDESVILYEVMTWQ